MSEICLRPKDDKWPTLTQLSVMLAQVWNFLEVHNLSGEMTSQGLRITSSAYEITLNIAESRNVVGISPNRYTRLSDEVSAPYVVRMVTWVKKDRGSSISSYIVPHLGDDLLALFLAELRSVLNVGPLALPDAVRLLQ